MKDLKDILDETAQLLDETTYANHIERKNIAINHCRIISRKNSNKKPTEKEIENAVVHIRSCDPNREEVYKIINNIKNTDILLAEELRNHINEIMRDNR